MARISPIYSHQNTPRTGPRNSPGFGRGVRGVFTSEDLGSGNEVGPKSLVGLGPDGAAGQD